MLPLVIAAALLPAELTVTREVTVRTSLRAKTYVWVVTDGVAIVPRLVRDNGRAVTFDHRAGSRYFVAVTALAEDGTEQAESTVIGVVDPPGPVPPGPTPGPTPPRPDPPRPDPTPSPPAPGPSPVKPIAPDGLHVLIVYDAGKPIPESQWAIITGARTRQWLEANAAPVPGNPNRPRAYRIWPANVAADAEAAIWRDAYARPRTGTPWWIVTNGTKAGVEGPLPATEAEALKVLEAVKAGRMPQ